MSRLGGLGSCITSDAATTMCHYYYLYNKYSDLIETFIFVLRKKQKQVSFLHVYHHIIVILAATLSLYLAPGNQKLLQVRSDIINNHIFLGGMTSILGVINCFVHFAMYAYYFVTIYDRKTIEKYDYLKKRLTQLQLVRHTKKNELIANYLSINYFFSGSICTTHCLFYSSYFGNV